MSMMGPATLDSSKPFNQRLTDAVFDRLSTRTARRAVKLATTGAVTDLQCSGTPPMWLSATVMGSSPEAYRVEVDLTTGCAWCTCPCDPAMVFSQWCKHVAAVVLVTAEQQNFRTTH